MDFQPAVYEHAASFVGRSPWEVSRDADLLYEAHAAAYEKYRHAPVTVGIDIYNVEAEAYGSVVSEPAACGVPAIQTFAYGEIDELAHLDPFVPSNGGRTSLLLNAAARLKARYPKADVRIPVSGPYSLAANLIGFEPLLCSTAIDPSAVARALDHIVHGQVDLCRRIASQGLGIVVFESAAAPPMVSPARFRQFVLPSLTRLIREAGRLVARPVACIMGGNTHLIVDAMLETGTNYLICPFETDQHSFLEKVWDRTEVRIRVNSNVDAVSRGNWEQIRAEADRIIRLVAGRPNVCMGTGILPYDTPPDNVLRLKEYIINHEARLGAPPAPHALGFQRPARMSERLGKET
jgi:uroporphyrinogen decarboxylase